MQYKELAIYFGYILTGLLLSLFLTFIKEKQYLVLKFIGLSFIVLNSFFVYLFSSHADINFFTGLFFGILYVAAVWILFISFELKT